MLLLLPDDPDKSSIVVAVLDCVKLSLLVPQSHRATRMEILP